MKTAKYVLAALILTTLMLLGAEAMAAGSLQEDRPYEPVVVTGGRLAKFYDVPIDEIYMYAYNATEGTWRLIPFQIDERTYGPMPETTRSRWFYFIPEEWAEIDTIGITSHDGVLSDHDELVFMVRDLGDKAPDHIWIDNEEAKNNLRLEIQVSDPDNPEKTAYGYLFRSTSIADEVPTPYGLSFDPNGAVHVLDCVNYTVGFDTLSGLIQDIAIKPPLGSGVDFFDTQKLRFNGVFDFGFFTFVMGRGDAYSANERDNLFLYKDTPEKKEIYFTPNPVVRVVRQVRETLHWGEIVIHQAAFFVEAKFYPYSGTLSGGADLDTESLKEVLGTEEDLYIQLDLIRQSWDFNANAVGMKFYNSYNQDVVIDGVPDEVDKTVDVPIREWSLFSGDQGTLFTFASFKDQSWQNIELYYYDNAEGGHSDSTSVPEGDTGDGISYGDTGILFESLPANEDSVSLELGFTAYFIEKNKDKAFGEYLAHVVENPAQVTTRAISFPTGVADREPVQVETFALFQNYPNPFNSSTEIRFHLPEAAPVTLRIIDLNGRTVATLLDGYRGKGNHRVVWNGVDDGGVDVPSGLYFYEIRTPNHSDMKKLILVK